MPSSLVDVIQKYFSLGISQQLDYDKFYLYSIITHSTAIEGSTITEIENQLLFDEGISAKKPMAEQLMNLDLKHAYEESFHLAQIHEDYSIKLLCHLSSLVMKNTGSIYKTMTGDFSSAKGDLRLVNVSAGFGGKSYLSWQKIPHSLEKFCCWINQERKKIKQGDIEQIYRLSFEAHYHLVNIHPWADGNGRMSRLVMNMIQHEFEVIPSIVKKDNRAEYIQALIQSQEENNSNYFVDFMLHHHEQNLSLQIQEYQTSMESEASFGGQKIVQGGQKKWSETTLKILELIRKNPKISRKELCLELQINPSAVQKHIEHLKNQHIIERIGGIRAGEWKILQGN